MARRRRRVYQCIMADGAALSRLRSGGKFVDPDFAQGGAPRAVVPFTGLDTLWVNTGTLCNIECKGCYIESSPTNDRLGYLSLAEFAPYLTEAKQMGAREVGFTGGEPFMNNDLLIMSEAALCEDLSVLILTNAMRPSMRPAMRAGVKRLAETHGGRRFRLRVSFDHWTAERHDELRGEGSFAIALEGLKAFAKDGASLAVAGRQRWGDSEEKTRAGYAALFAEHQLNIDVSSPHDLVLFPEMDEGADTPEITSACWNILGKQPDNVMCASSRMLIRKKDDAPSIVACTLIVDDPQFVMGRTLAEAARPVKLNHPHCSRFCVLGGASCSA